jgi:hypothetical protein
MNLTSRNALALNQDSGSRARANSFALLEKQAVRGDSRVWLITSSRFETRDIMRLGFFYDDQRRK